jgi:hypothetical protein
VATTLTAIGTGLRRFTPIGKFVFLTTLGTRSVSARATRLICFEKTDVAVRR